MVCHAVAAWRTIPPGGVAGIFRLAEGVWWMEMPRLSREAEDPVIRTTVFCASLESYSTFVFGLPEKQRAFMANPPSEVWWLRDAGPLDLTKGTPDGFRAMGTTGYDGKPEKGMRAIGRVGKWLVWIGGVAKGDWAVNFNPDGREEVSNWLDRLGLKVKQKIPITLRVNGKNVGHDYYGWPGATQRTSAMAFHATTDRSGPAFEAKVAEEAQRLASRSP